MVVPNRQVLLAVKLGLFVVICTLGGFGGLALALTGLWLIGR